MVMQIKRTATSDNPPIGLAEGQLAVEMASDPIKFWIGVPTALDPSGRREVGFRPEAPQNGLGYARKDNNWVPIWQEVLRARVTNDMTPTAGLWWVPGSFGGHGFTATIDMQGGFNQPSPGWYAPKVPGLYFFILRAHGTVSHFVLTKNGGGTIDMNPGIAFQAGDWNQTTSAVTYMNGTTDNINAWFHSGAGGNVAPMLWPTLQAWLLG